MRKNIIYGIILLAAVACNKEMVRNDFANPLAEGEKQVSIKGRIELPTRVEFNDIDGKFAWSATDDTIAIHISKGARGETEMIPAAYKKALVVPDHDNPSSCDFFFVMSEGQKRDFFAVYPASVVDDNNYGDQILKINLPSEYTVTPTAGGMAGYCPTPMVAVNDPDSDEIFFRHVGGLLRLTLNDVSPVTSTIEVSLGKRLTGSFTVNDPATPAPYIETDDAADVLTFTFTEPLANYADGFVLNVPVPTGTYEMLSVKAKDSEGDVVFAYDDDKVRSFYSGRGRRAETAISFVGYPLCLEAKEDATVQISNPNNLTIEYSRDNRADSWTQDNGSSISIPLELGECIYLRGDNECYQGMNITTAGECYIYGNIMSLLSSTGFTDRFDLRSDSAFESLFHGASELVNHPEKSLELPATDLTPSCYAYMFLGCSGLTSMPYLPATHLEEMCYGAMFDSCTGLEKTPASLPATELANSCYTSMFYGCSSLSSAPSLPALILAESCYEWMFGECVSLTAAPDLPALELPKGCYYLMFCGCISLAYVKAMCLRLAAGASIDDVFGEDWMGGWLTGVSETGTFVKNSEATWNNSDYMIPSTWTIEYASE